MGVKEKNKSLLEIAVELFRESPIREPKAIKTIAKEAMERKGLKTATGKELLPQFYADFMQSGYFVFCGDGKWILKEYADTSILDKGYDENGRSEEEEEAAKNELRTEDDSSSSESTVEESYNSTEEEPDDFDGLGSYEGESDDNDNENISVSDIDLSEPNVDVVSEAELEDLEEEKGE